jgi:hypothetical protein
MITCYSIHQASGIHFYGKGDEQHKQHLELQRPFLEHYTLLSTGISPSFGRYALAFLTQDICMLRM